jgi:HD-GYP domain-containing protein (c-di-GMP phosphodiesterase class II)
MCLPHAVPVIEASDMSESDRQTVETIGHVLTPPPRRAILAQAIAAVAFLAAAVAMAATLEWTKLVSLPVLILLVLGYVTASLVAFDVGTGFTDPSQLFFVSMLFLVPAPLVPFLVAFALVLGRIPECMRRELHPARLVSAVGDAWYCLGPVLIFSIAGVDGPTPSGLGIYVAAFASQLVFDNVAYTTRSWATMGVAPRLSLIPWGWASLIDGMLSCGGLLIAFATFGQPYLLLLLIPFLGVFVLFSRDRRARIDGAVELSQAYRGTALLLGNVVEADHAYTGSHSRDVVDLSVAVAQAMGLSEVQRRNAEFGALLHDIGKIAVPKEIIDKPGPLDDAEWVVMKQHTIKCQEMLDQVGGVLGKAGVVVRASHEHFDGSGYPDGLVGDEIPIEARIVTCCDAFSAMTTDRSYRRSMTFAEALEELDRCAGTQFDPKVIETLWHVLVQTMDIDGEASKLPRARSTTVGDVVFS